MSEDQLQSKFYQYVWNNYPQLRRCIWAVPNGGLRDKVTAAKLKATGMLKGVWDLHIFYRGQFYIIETKIGNNQLTPEQIEWRALMVAHGAKAFVYRTINEGVGIINQVLCGNVKF